MHVKLRSLKFTIPVFISHSRVTTTNILKLYFHKRTRVYLFKLEVIGALILEQISSGIPIGSEKDILQINGERRGSGADSCADALPFFSSAFPSIAELPVHKPAF